MTTSTAAQPSPLAQSSGVLRSELCKLRSVRSTFWALAAAVAFNVVVAAALAIFLPGRLSPHEKASIDSVRVSLGGLHLSQLAIGLLGVLTITSEYGTGMIRATLAAVPQRRLMLAAKAIVLAAAALVTGTGASFAAYLVFEAFLPAGDAMRTSLADPGVLRAVTGAGLYLAVLGLLAMAVAGLIRHTAGAITAVIGFVLVLAPLSQLIPDPAGKYIHAYLPTEAGQLVVQTHRAAGDVLSWWQGFGVFVLWVVVLLAAAGWLLQRRDA